LKISKIKFISPVIFSLFISACGGGSSGTSDTKKEQEVTPNVLPTVSAGQDSSFMENLNATLLGSVSDSDGTIVSVLWEQTAGTTVSLNDADKVEASFTAPEVDLDEVLIFTLTATDDTGATSLDTINVTVIDVPIVNELPVIDIEDDKTIPENTATTIQATATDNDGSIVSVVWQQTTGTAVTLTNANSATASFITPEVTSDEVLAFTFTATDDSGDSTTNNLSVTVTNTPQINGIMGSISFERFVFMAIPDEPGNVKVDTDNQIIETAKNIVVELVGADSTVVSVTTTDNNGVYRFDLTESDLNKVYTVRMIAQLELDNIVNNGFKIVVTDQSTNTELAQQTVYSYESDPVTYSSIDIIYDITLPNGWDAIAQDFIANESHAQPFAILETVNRVAQYLKAGGISYSVDNDDLYINWTRATNSTERFAGFYSASQNRIFLNGDVSHTIDARNGVIDMYSQAPIEEWNEVTITHEFVHYYTHKVLKRDDTRGGDHEFWFGGDVSMAFSEGFATAIAFKLNGSWIDQRMPLDITGPTSGDDLYEAASNGNINNCRVEGTSSEGDTVTLDCFQTSPFSESTSVLFVLSLLDGDKETSNLTENIADKVGLVKVITAFENAAQHEAKTSIYSFASELKAANPDISDDLAILGTKLNTSFVDAWGAGQEAPPSILIDGNAPLPVETYLPVYLQINANETNNVCFNGGYFLGSNRRPGTSRIIRFKATEDGMMLLQFPDAVDGQGRTHTYRTHTTYKGEQAELANLFPNGLMHEQEFMARTGQEYVIELEGQEYLEDPAYSVNDTICTTLTLSTQ